MTRDDGLDLLTAALLGAVVGAGTALMFSRSRRPAPLSARMLKAARKSARQARGWGRRGARNVGGMASDLWENDVRKQVAAYFDSVREAIDETVSSELQDIRKGLRRRRKKLGI